MPIGADNFTGGHTEGESRTLQAEGKNILGSGRSRGPGPDQRPCVMLVSVAGQCASMMVDSSVCTGQGSGRSKVFEIADAAP